MLREIFILVGLTGVGMFMSHYALAMFLRIKNVYMPLSLELSPIIKDQEKLSKLFTRLRTDRVMSAVIFLLAPLLVLSVTVNAVYLLPYFFGVGLDMLQLRGKCGYSESNLYLYFYTYRFYFQDELALYDDPKYHEYMAYRRRSLVEQALDAEEKKYREAQAEKKG